MGRAKTTSVVPDRDFLTLAYDASSDCMKMLAVDGTILAINASGVSAMGLDDPARLIGRSWTGLWSGDIRRAAQRELTRAGDGRSGSFRAPLSTAQGVTKWWDITLIPVPNGRERPDRLLAISKDVTAQHVSKQALERSARLQQALIEATSEIVWHVDLSTGVTVRRGYLAFTGRPDDPADMDGWLDAVHPEDRDRAKRAADEAVVNGRALSIEYRLQHRSGEWRWVEDHAIPVRDESGTMTDWVGIITDIDDRKSAEQALRKSAEHLRLAVEATGLGTWDVDLRTGERNWSPEMFDLMRLPRATPADRAVYLESIHPDDRTRVDRELMRPDRFDERARISIFRFLFPSGDVRWIEAHERTFFDAEGSPIRRVGTMQDVTERKQAEQEVWLAAHTDPLTGIANRALFQSRLDQAVLDARVRDSRVALLLIDLDRFKEVNDTLGHDAGDLMLRAVANRIKVNLPETATVARLGGDEFGVIVPDAAATSDLAAHLLVALYEPLSYAGREIECSASIGWSVCPDQAQQPSTLLKNADLALYAAKSAGRTRVAMFVPEMQAELERRFNVLRCAKEALARGSIVPFYQPKVSLETAEIIGFEALLRWTDGNGLRMPGAIQEALDDPELSIRIGSRMLEKTIADMQVWTVRGEPFGHVALNVAAPEFQGGGLVDRVLGALDEAGLRPEQLEIEVTERVLMDDAMSEIESTLQGLHERGVSIALDDFGTGYASLTHLTRFPVSWVKIDRSFVSNLEVDSGAAAVVRAVTGLAHSVRAKVIAEGVETREQLAFLSRVGCDVGQGYWLAKPMSGSRVPHFLRTWDREKVARVLTEAKVRHGAWQGQWRGAYR